MDALNYTETNQQDMASYVSAFYHFWGEGNRPKRRRCQFAVKNNFISIIMKWTAIKYTHFSHCYPTIYSYL